MSPLWGKDCVIFSMNGACRSYLTVLAAVTDANWSPHLRAFRGEREPERALIPNRSMLSYWSVISPRGRPIVYSLLVGELVFTVTKKVTEMFWRLDRQGSHTTELY